MKWRRGFFRLWVIFAAAWLAGTIAVVAPSVWEQWKLAQTMKEFDDAGIVTLVPTDCQLARGREGTIRDGADYERREAKCWYELLGFRRLFPEYADLADKKLTSTLYQKAGIPLKEAEPMKAIGELLLIGLGIPLLLLGVGFVLAWALRGFSTAH
jgi:hypothetical protein